MAVDPCGLLFGQMKTDCENARNGGLTGIITGGGGTGIVGDLRHFMMRVAEVGVGVLLIIVAANALVKQSGTVNVVVKGVKKVAK